MLKIMHGTKIFNKTKTHTSEQVLNTDSIRPSALPSFCPSVHSFQHLVRPPVQPSILLSNRPSIHLPVRPSVSQSGRPSNPSVHLYVHPSVCPSICPSVCPSFRLSVRLSVHPFLGFSVSSPITDLTLKEMSVESG